MHAQSRTEEDCIFHSSMYLHTTCTYTHTLTHQPLHTNNASNVTYLHLRMHCFANVDIRQSEVREIS